MSEQNRSIFSESFEVFMHFGKCNNLAETAHAFGISLSSASRQIRKLENTLGVDLIVTGKRPFTLTSEGKNFYSQMEIQKKGVKGFVEELRSKNSIGKQLRIGFIESYTQAAATIIGNCSKELSSVLNVSGTTDRLSQLFNDGEIDVTITSELPADIGKLRCFTFIKEPTVVVLPKSILAGIPKTPKWENLSFCGLPYILSYKRSRSGKALISFLLTHGINFHSQVEVDNIGTKLGLIAQGKGWSLIPITSLYQNRAMLDGDFLNSIAFLPSPKPIFSRQLMTASNSNFNQDLFWKLSKELSEFSETFIQAWAENKFPWVQGQIQVFHPDPRP